VRSVTKTGSHNPRTWRSHDMTGMAQARIRPPCRLGRAGGHGFGQPEDKVKSRGPEVPSEGLRTMQLELSNFQRVASGEAIEQEVADLGCAEQLSEPMMEESDQGLASLTRLDHPAHNQSHASAFEKRLRTLD